MAHQGEALHSAILNSPYAIDQVAKKLDVTDRTLYKWFLRPTLKSYMIDRVSEAISVNLRVKSPAIFGAPTSDIIVPTRPNDTETFWHGKYTGALEEIIKLKEENAQLREQLAAK
jgi:hypothetical protein